MSNFYRSKEWIKKRSEILKRDHYECIMCKEKGKVKKANCVHHIKYVQDYPELSLSDSNLISLCNTCHNKIHDRLFKFDRKKRIFIMERW